MSEQKYYVKLKEEFQATGVTFADMSLYLYKNGAFDYGHNSYPFTKSELAEIMDGAILKKIPGGTHLDDLEKDRSHYNWIDDCNYWVNPLIELVPVEVEE